MTASVLQALGSRVTSSFVTCPTPSSATSRALEWLVKHHQTHLQRAAQFSSSPRLSGPGTGSAGGDSPSPSNLAAAKVTANAQSTRGAQAVPLFNADILPLQTGRPRLLVLGSGWAAARLLHDIDPKVYDLTVSHMPHCHCALLTGTCSGTCSSGTSHGGVLHL